MNSTAELIGFPETNYTTEQYKLNSFKHFLQQEFSPVQVNNPIKLKEIGKPSQASTYHFIPDEYNGKVIFEWSESNDPYIEFELQLRRMARLNIDKAPNLNQIPSRKTIAGGKKILQLLRRYTILPSKISSLSEGGIIFEVIFDKEYYSIELYNDGENVFLHTNDTIREAYDLNFHDLLLKIRDTFNG